MNCCVALRPIQWSLKAATPVGWQLRCRAARFARGMGPDKDWQVNCPNHSRPNELFGMALNDPTKSKTLYVPLPQRFAHAVHKACDVVAYTST